MCTTFALIKLASRQVAKIGGHLYSISGIIAISCTIAAPVLAQDDNREDSLLEFFAGQGCAIGPTTRAAAIAAGYNAHEIDLLGARAWPDSGTVWTRGWLVLPPSICQIRVPEVNNLIQLSDPEVIASLSAPDAYTSQGEPGCFLSADILQEQVQKTRNWDEDTAFVEYLRFLSASLISGDLAFYSDSPLKTPAGFIVATGECANIPLMPAIKRNHELMIKHFGAFIRANAANTICEYGGSIMGAGWHEIADTLTDGKNTNAWLSFEYQIIAMGAGWYEDISYTNHGMPRPPLCHYE